MEWARGHVAGHRKKENVDSMSDRQRGKERALAFNLRVIRLFILSSFIFLSPPPHMSLTFVFINLHCCVIALMLEVNFNCFHQKWPQVGHKWRFL